MGDRALLTSVTYNRDFSKITHYVYFLYPQAVTARITMAKTFDGPPTLERSGSEHRVGRFPPSLLRREGRGERWSLP